MLKGFLPAESIAAIHFEKLVTTSNVAPKNANNNFIGSVLPERKGFRVRNWPNKHFGRRDYT